jgi:uncharacterized protein YycO
MKSMILSLFLVMILFGVSCMIPFASAGSGTQNLRQRIAVYHRAIALKNDNTIGTYNLQPGDIVWRWSIVPMVTHCMLYVGQNEDHQYAFIEANAMEDVWRPTYNETWINAELFNIIYRIRAEPTTIQKAIEFAEAQVGKQFAYIHEKEFNPDTEFWYCTELIWAAYYAQGIDIDLNGWEDNYLFQYPVVLPYEMLFDTDIDVFPLHVD